MRIEDMINKMNLIDTSTNLLITTIKNLKEKQKKNWILILGFKGLIVIDYRINRLITPAKFCR